MGRMSGKKRGKDQEDAPEDSEEALGVRSKMKHKKKFKK